SMTRAQDEIVARIREAAPADFFGWRQEVLVCALDFEHAREFLIAEATADQWTQRGPETEAREYYTFALGKIRDHRGISAERSTIKLAEFAWLLGRDDVIEAMEAAVHPQYGAPKVKAFADGLGLAWPDESGLNRMAAGEPCTPDCREGCGQ
ncbi:hypothetical protein, partial [Streptomyces albidoflavus]|uniref:hypothetical protein n=1 Tax=Streptomyces albidoflavus TaxID=1886 RepID=UPI00332CA933